MLFSLGGRSWFSSKSNDESKRATSTEVEQWLIWHCRRPTMMMTTKWIETSPTTTSREYMMISGCVCVGWKRVGLLNMIPRRIREMSVADCCSWRISPLCIICILSSVILPLSSSSSSLSSSLSLSSSSASKPKHEYPSSYWVKSVQMYAMHAYVAY